MELKITITNIQARVPVTVLRLQGNIDAGSAGYFDQTLMKTVDSGAKDILLDFSDVQFMSSVGIRTLSAGYDWLHPFQSVEEKKAISQAVRQGTYKAPHLKLLNVSERVAMVLEMSGLSAYFESFDNETQALEAF
jgi:anti-anti-sigma regulatory factor